MKKFTAAIATVLLLSLILLLPASAAGAGTVVYSNTQQIADNLLYTNTVSYINNTERQQGYALSLTGKGDAYPIVLVDETIYGGGTIEQVVAYAERQGRNVLAAVNTDFFSMRTGVPMGLVVENGVYKSSPDGLTAVAFTQDGGVHLVENPQVTIALTNNGGDTDKTNSGKTESLTNFNKYRMDTGGLYLYSSDYSSVSTRTSSAGWFVKLKILSGTPALSGTMSLQVVDTVKSNSSMPIGEGYMVLTAADECGYAETYAKFKTGDRVTLTTTCSDATLAGAKWATGGGDVLIKKGAITDAAKWDKEIIDKNPRTAFGFKLDGTVISLVVDGRESDHSAGLTLQSLAEELQQRGCEWAVNFDGGGSSALSARLPGTATSAVMNSPSDGSSRTCASYLLFVTDKAPDGRVKYLNVINEGPVVLAGSSVSLSFGASDGGYKPVAVPSDIVASSEALGSVKGTTYTAGPVHGVDTVILSSSSTGASGTGSVHIIYDPTDLDVTATGVTGQVTSITVWPGDTVQFAATASYNGLPVAADTAAFKYTAAGDIGTVTSAGLYTAAKNPGAKGSITVTAGGKSVVIPVTVTGFSDTVDHWAKTYIRGLMNMGIVTGTSPTTFSPDVSIHRGDFVLMLYRAAGKPAVTGNSSFKDVKPTDYYASAIAWAEQNKIALGDAGLFKPQDKLTREQAFALAYRALGALKISAKDGTADDLAAFKDKKNVAAYAVTPTATLVRMGVVTGADGQLKPTAAMSRGEMAKILYMIIGYDAKS